MRPFSFMLASAMALLLSGCLVKEEDFEEARRRKEELTAELVKLHQGNDQLNHEISRLYADREVISGHVAMTAAVAMHNRLTAGFRPASPPPQASPPPAPARPAAGTQRPAQAPRPAQIPPPPSPPSDGARPLPSPPPIRGGVDWGPQAQ